MTTEPGNARRASGSGGRQAQASLNDGRILAAARAVFLADPGAPMSAVGSRAGVGMSALYRRYPGKEELLRELARDALQRYADDLSAALAEVGDPWHVYSACLGRIVEGRSQALAQRLAGTFTPTAELGALAVETGRLGTELHERTRASGALREDVSAADVVLLLETVMLVELPGPDGGAALRRRYLALLLQGLKAPAPPLPGEPARAEDLAARWRTPR